MAIGIKASRPNWTSHRLGLSLAFVYSVLEKGTQTDPLLHNMSILEIVTLRCMVGVLYIIMNIYLQVFVHFKDIIRLS